MELTIQEAREKLDILEATKQNPELILTELFQKNTAVATVNLLNRVSIDNLYRSDYLKKCLSQMPVFSDCIISVKTYDIWLYLPALKREKYSDIIQDDLVVTIDTCRKEYTVSDECIKYYKDKLTETHIYTPKKQDEFWSMFTDLSFTGRMKQNRMVVHSNDKLRVKLAKLLFWTFMTEKKKNTIRERLKSVNEELDNTNKYRMEVYKENVERQGYYKKYAPVKIKKIRDKQEAIKEYLDGLGYTDISQELSQRSLV